MCQNLLTIHKYTKKTLVIKQKPGPDPVLCDEDTNWGSSFDCNTAKNVRGDNRIHAWNEK